VPDYLGHLPPATTTTFIEINMTGIIHEKTIKAYSHQLQKRDKNRKNKAFKEDKYSVKVDKFADKKFEDLKKQSFGFVSSSEKPS
jgi:hypothetical protein